MIRVFVAVGFLAAIPMTATAEESVVRLSVRPMAAPKPAMKYQLLPEVREMNPGNAVQWYIRCFAEQRNFFFTKEANAERAKYQAMPLGELPGETLRNYGGSALSQADWAARLDICDWEVLRRVQTDGLDLTLPELGSLRILAAGLQVRFRGEIARRDFDSAVRTAKTMFGLARHLGEHPTEQANRIGLSIAHVAFDTVTEMVQQPGCPNLYWALTNLPGPLVDLRKGLQGQCSLATSELRPLRDDAPMSAAELEEFVSRISGTLGFVREQTGQEPRSLRAKLAARVKDTARVQAARVRLVAAAGVSVAFQKFDPVQIILLDEKREYEAQRDERVKLLGLAPWQIDALTGQEFATSWHRLFADLLPNVIALRREQGRLDQRIAMLRHVEALRMHAAIHKGELPAALNAVWVPLPDDPFTGKPFYFQPMGSTTAAVRGGAPRGEVKNPAFNVRYEVTIRE